MDTLPNEITAHVLSFVSAPYSRRICRAICTLWRALVIDVPLVSALGGAGESGELHIVQWYANIGRTAYICKHVECLRAHGMCIMAMGAAGHATPGCRDILQWITRASPPDNSNLYEIILIAIDAQNASAVSYLEQYRPGGKIAHKLKNYRRSKRHRRSRRQITVTRRIFERGFIDYVSTRDINRDTLKHMCGVPPLECLQYVDRKIVKWYHRGCHTSYKKVSQVAIKHDNVDIANWLLRHSKGVNSDEFMRDAAWANAARIIVAIAPRIDQFAISRSISLALMQDNIGLADTLLALLSICFVPSSDDLCSINRKIAKWCRRAGTPFKDILHIAIKCDNVDVYEWIMRHDNVLIDDVATMSARVNAANIVEKIVSNLSQLVRSQSLELALINDNIDVADILFMYGSEWQPTAQFTRKLDKKDARDAIEWLIGLEFPMDAGVFERHVNRIQWDDICARYWETAFSGS